MRTFVMGDLHGGFPAFMQCLQRAGFDNKVDRLIQIGDIVDGYCESFECVEALLGIKNKILILGNHDHWFAQFCLSDFHPHFWNYGGEGTLVSYLKHCGKPGAYKRSSTGFKTALVNQNVPNAHKQLLDSQVEFYIDSANRLFVHAGFNRLQPFSEQAQDEYTGNRSLWTDAMKHASYTKQFPLDVFFPFDQFSEIFIGHSPTITFGFDVPMQVFNIINIDTGAGSSGKLTIMDVETKKFWQSDPLPVLYGKRSKNIIYSRD